MQFKAFSLIFLLWLINPVVINSQESIDSLQKELSRASTEINKCDILNNLAKIIINQDPDKAKEFSETAKQLASKINYSDGLAFAYYNLGNVAYYQDDYESALKLLIQAEDLFKKTNNKEGFGNVYNTRGEVLTLKGMYSDALASLFSALKYFGEAKDNPGLSRVNINIGLIHFYQKNYKEALKYFTQSLTTADEVSTGDASMHIGKVYVAMDEYAQAKKYLETAFEIGTKNEDNYVISDCYYLLGKIDLFFGDKEKAKQKYLKSLSIHKDLENYQGEAICCNELGKLFLNNNDIPQAISYFKEAYETANSKGIKEEVKHACLGLSNAYNYEKSYDSAYHYLKLNNKVNEELLSEEASKKLAELEASLAAQKREAEIESERKLRAFTNRVFIFSGIGIILVLIIFAFVMYNRYKMKQKANLKLEAFNREISQQRDIIEQKNHEILDSIRYAKRIQEAILPSNELMKSVLKDFFVLYKPKDIVSGDFYWANTIVENGCTKLLFAAVDCTGHGVPGALVSVVGNNGLGRAVKEFKLVRPSDVLDKLNVLVEETFKQAGSADIKDGMDINLCLFSYTPEGGALLEFAAANNPLWLVKNKDGIFEVEEVRADKQPIGAYLDRKPFTNHVFELKKGDCFFIFSDGYADQFGGDKGKKFKYKQLQDIILENIHKPMNEQSDILNQAFEKWRGNLEQVDDVCVIGVRV